MQIAAEALAPRACSRVPRPRILRASPAIARGLATLFRVARGFGVPVETLFGASANDAAALALRDAPAPARPLKPAPNASSDEALAPHELLAPAAKARMPRARAGRR